jgi:hypothetical protein
VVHHTCKAVPHKSPPETQTVLKPVMIRDLAIVSLSLIENTG